MQTMTDTNCATVPEIVATRLPAPFLALAGCPDTPKDGTGQNQPKIEAEAETPETFTPDTADKADWVLSKIADARARAARIRENAEKIARAHDAEAEGLEFRFGPALQDFAARELAGGKRKSLRLLNGVLGWRTRPASVSLVNPTAALVWAQQHLPAAVVETLDRKALAERLLETGESVDWAAFQPEEQTFYIK